MGFSASVHGVAAALVVLGLPALSSGTIPTEPPISVAIVTADDAVGYALPDRLPNVRPGDAPELAGEGLSAPLGDVADAAPAPDDAPPPVGDASATVQTVLAAARAIEGKANDNAGRDSPPPGEPPQIEITRAALAAPVTGDGGRPVGAPLTGPVEPPRAGAAMVLAQSTDAPSTDNGQAAPSAGNLEWMAPRPASLAELSAILRRELAEIRAEIENRDIPPAAQARALETAAEQGDADAQYRLAAHYQLGLGVPEDPAMAVSWYREAAEKRLVDAQLRLGDMLANGDGVPAAPVEAQAWWSVAAASGEPLTRAGAELLSPRLTPLELSDAIKLAHNIEAVWTSWERWTAADSGGAVDDRLLAAAGVGDVAAIKRLIDAGASPNAADSRGRSALLISVVNGHSEAAEALLRRGANVNGADAEGKTALMWALDAGHEKTAKALLKRGADIDARDKFGQTALINAAWRGRDAIIGILLAIGADPNAKSVEGVTALMWAAINGYPRVAERLIHAGADVEAADKGRFTPLIRAAWNGHAETVAVLLDNGARVGAKSTDGKTALRLAHGNGYPEIVEMLRGAGAIR